ncbi:MAG: C-GCAxxG-C-C family (seleno)protein [Bacteroidota bacterium]
MPPPKEKLSPRKTFWNDGACSHAMFHLINHEFDNSKVNEEKAADIMAGGLAQKGYQCGMLWGGALAVGTESYRRYKDKDEATASAIIASQHLIESFSDRTKAVNCREITGVDFGNKLEFAISMIKTILRGFVFSPCFNLIAKWTPEAIQAAKNGLDSKHEQQASPLSCSSEVVKKMGASNEEATMVAGFAGGIGLSGNACGALAAAIWFKTLKLAKENNGDAAEMFDNQDVRNLFTAFNNHTKSEVFCSKICGKQFKSIDEHTVYLKNGGCEKLIETLATQ